MSSNRGSMICVLPVITATNMNIIRPEILVSTVCNDITFLRAIYVREWQDGDEDLVAWRDINRALA
jgi:hypothetical protein